MHDWRQLTLSTGPTRETLCWLVGHELEERKRCALFPGLDLVEVACRWCDAGPPDPILVSRIDQVRATR